MENILSKSKKNYEIWKKNKLLEIDVYCLQTFLKRFFSTKAVLNRYQLNYEILKINDYLLLLFLVISNKKYMLSYQIYVFV